MPGEDEAARIAATRAMTPEEARAWKERWRLVNEREIEELRNMLQPGQFTFTFFHDG